MQYLKMIGAIPHINPSIYSIETTSTSCLLMLSVLLLLFFTETAKMLEPSEIRFRFDESGTVSDRYESSESNSSWVSDLPV